MRVASSVALLQCLFMSVSVVMSINRKERDCAGRFDSNSALRYVTSISHVQATVTRRLRQSGEGVRGLLTCDIKLKHVFSLLIPKQLVDSYQKRFGFRLVLLIIRLSTIKTFRFFKRFPSVRDSLGFKIKIFRFVWACCSYLVKWCNSRCVFCVLSVSVTSSNSKVQLQTVKAP